MPESSRLPDLVQARIDNFLAARSSILSSLGPDVLPLQDFSREFLSGGKRFRAQFCYRGWRSVGGAPAHDAVLGAPVLGAAAALEVFHAAALLHDDIIDSSDTRRGAPSAHRHFEGLHREAGFAGDPGRYGRSAALLLGDLLLGWSDELIDEAMAQAIAALGAPQAALAARREFNLMRLEVTAGQYLDILEENAWSTHPDDEQLARAERVIVFKSAKYSVEAPLAIGALLAGGTVDQVDALRRFGLPLGIAYQLRDDLLGVFGDADVTGKPSGDDLREGKRTVLIALARTALDERSVRMLDALLGDPGLDDAQVEWLQQTIAGSGAVQRVEQRIAENVRQAVAAIETGPIDADSRQRLRGLADAVTRRSA